MKIEPQASEPDPYAHADSPSAIMAYVFSKAGEEGLRALLNQIETDKESLERDAAELNAGGLPEVAAIVLKAADSAIPAHVMHCPYAETDIHNYESWMAAYQRRQRMKVAVS